MSHLLIFGLGYTASRIAAELRRRGWVVEATGSAGDLNFRDGAAVRDALTRASHVLSSAPPADGLEDGADPVLGRYGTDLTQEWVGYLSSTGVYGDAGGAWVDETAEIGTGRRTARAEADGKWLERGARVFRLPGIYGPERNALTRVQAGRANRIDLPGQVFSRVHVDDIVSGVIAGLAAPAGAYNLSDDLPASQNSVIEEACALLGRNPPPLLTLEEAKLSPMARGFYGENRRVANGKARRVLGWRPAYPDFKVGLRNLL